MAKRNRTPSQAKNERKLMVGKGQGEGADYKPWLTIQEVSGDGRVSRGRGWKSKRVHHLMSTEELYYFYTTEWSPIVVDVREQYPLLPLERTVEIAKSLGLEKSHPGMKKFGEPVVMTTDLMLTVEIQGARRLWARTVKPVAKLSKLTLDKFRIEYEFYKEQGIDWGLITNLDIPKTLAKNVEWLHEAFYLADNKDFYLRQSDIEFLEPKLFDAFVANPTVSFSSIASNQDRVRGLEPGTSLLLVKYFLAHKTWETNMQQKIRPAQNGLVIARSAERSARRELA